MYVEIVNTIRGFHRMLGRSLGNNSAVMCEHPKAVDFRGSRELIMDFNVRFENRALCSI